MSRNKPISAVVVPLLIVLAFTGPVFAAPVEATESSSLFGSSWFDWSDYRGAIGVRVFFARLSGGSLEIGDRSFDLKRDFGFTDDPEPFRELWGEFYVDRLGIRFQLEEAEAFRGRVGSLTESSLDPTIIEGAKVSELETNTGRFGVDLDIVRYPFLRLGVNADYYLGKIKFQDRRSTNTGDWAVYHTAQPITAGFHGLAIPARIRGVPLTIKAAARFPITLLSSNKEAKITDLEISAGVRPAIWNLSSFGLSTFSVGLSGGFRSVNLDAVSSLGNMDVRLKARWQGAFMELSVNF